MASLGPNRIVRDERIDMLRGLSLMMIFVNHVPYNSLSGFTLRACGFSDASEIFVFLAGYSAHLVYASTYRRYGAAAACLRIGRRCLVIWATHVSLLLGSMAILLLRWRLTGHQPTLLAPLFEGGLAGILRGVTLQALPAYLDILPLYILLLATFPLIIVGLQRSVAVTLAGSFTLYLCAIVFGWNLPNRVDLHAASTWTFDPLAWQFIFVLGAAFERCRSRGRSWFVELPCAPRILCFAVLIFGFVAVDWWELWPGFAARLFPRFALDECWKCVAAPWRLLHSVALLLLLFNSRSFAAFSGLSVMQPVKACGRSSLTIFAAGCILALFGRIAFTDLGPSPAVQLAVNFGGISLQLALAKRLRRGKPNGYAPPQHQAAASPLEAPA